METFSKYILLADAIILSILFIIILVINSMLLYTLTIRKVNTRNNVRFCLIVHIVVWYIASLTGLILNLYLAFFWRLSYNYNQQVYFILGVPRFASLFAVYASRFCLTLDCVFVIKQWRNDYLNHFCWVFCLGITIVVGVFLALHAESEQTECWNLPCVFGRYNYNITNLFIQSTTVITFILSLFCLYLFWKSQKASNKHGGQSTLQRILRMSMTLDLHLNVLPQILVFSLEWMGVDTQSLFGPSYRICFVIYGVYLNYRFYKCLVTNNAVTPSATTSSKNDHFTKPKIPVITVSPIR